MTNKPTDGNVTGARTWTGPSTVTTFGDYGRVTSATNELGHRSSTSYSPAVNWPTGGVTVTNPRGHATTTVTSRLHGQMTLSRDPNGKVTEPDCDALGRLVTV